MNFYNKLNIQFKYLNNLLSLYNSIEKFKCLLFSNFLLSFSIVRFSSLSSDIFKRLKLKSIYFCISLVDSFAARQIFF